MNAFREYYRQHNQLPPAKYITPDGCKLGSWIAEMKSKNTCRKERNLLEKEFNIKIMKEYSIQ